MQAEDSPQIALRTLVAGAVALGVVVSALTLWEGRRIVLLLFLGYTLAAAMRPGVDAAGRSGIPKSVAVLGHFVALAGAVAALLWLFVPVALEQTQQALAEAETGGGEGTLDSVRQDTLAGLESRLNDLADPASALSALVGTFTVLAGIAFTLACAVYWVAARDRLVGLVLALVPHSRRTTVRDTWLLIDLKLGAVIRTKLLLVLFSATVLSLAFWAIGLPYFLVVGVFAGVVEVLPVIGPLIAGLVAVGAGLTVSWKVALAAAGVVYGLRLVQDYVINPRLFGHAVDLPPLAVLIAVSAVALMLGPLWVPLAIPLTAVVATILDVVVRKREPAEEPVPTALMPTDETVESRRRRPWRIGRRLQERTRSA